MKKPMIDYDKEVDVLYVNFGKPQKAEGSIQEEDCWFDYSKCQQV